MIDNVQASLKRMLLLLGVVLVDYVAQDFLLDTGRMF